MHARHILQGIGVFFALRLRSLATHVVVQHFFVRVTVVDFNDALQCERDVSLCRMLSLVIGPTCLRIC